MNAPRKGICGKCGQRVPAPSEADFWRAVWRHGPCWVKGHQVYVRRFSGKVIVRLVRCKDCGGQGFTTKAG